MGSEEVEEPVGQGDAPAAKKRPMKLIAAVAAALLLAGGGAAWWVLAPAAEEKTAEAHPEAIDAESLVDVPAMTVNLRTPDGAAKMLRVHLMLVPGTASRESIEGQLPLVVDAFQPFLRELRPEDLTGSAATFRLKEEMLLRSNSVLGQGSVRDVLIQDLVQQ